MSKYEKLQDIPYIGKKREEALNEKDINSLEDFKEANFYEIANLPSFGYVPAYKTKREVEEIIIDYSDMEEIKNDRMNGPIDIGDTKIEPWEEIDKLRPEDFEKEKSTIWSFEERGDWATHEPSFRGNWSPKVARNLIVHFSEEGDTVLDPMVGGGTTLIECLLTGRNGIGIDINRRSVMVTKNRISLPEEYLKELPDTTQKVYVGDSRNLNLVEDESIDLIATHPPYANIISYGKSAIKGDLSAIPDYEIYAEEMRRSASEFYRVLKPGKICAILIGDTHNRCHYVPIAFKVMKQFLKEGFILKEDIIKEQWNCESTAMWKNNSENKFLLTMHEHLFVFRKPKKGEKTSQYKNSKLSFLDG